MLMRHQEEGVAFLLARGSGLLAFEQGLGKTLVAIEAYQRLRERGETDLMVVICPNSLKRNWAAEIARFAPNLTTRIISAAGKERRRALAEAYEDVVVIHYEGARAEIMSLRALLKRHQAVLVLDESHHIKNRQSLTSVAAQHLAPLAQHRWLLSGTPVTNSPADIYSQIAVVAAGAVQDSFDVFMLDYGEASTDPEIHARLAHRVAPYLLRRTKEQCLDLPEKTFLDLAVPLPPWQRALYDAMRDGLIREIEGMSPQAYSAFSPMALTRLLRLSQIASNPRLVVPTETRVPAKVAELDALLEELVASNRRKVIVWSHYVATIRLLLDRYAKYGALALYGGVPGEDRQDVARQFQEDPSIGVLIGNPAAAGTGFTLTAATYTVYETLSWRYDYYAQSQDRNHRIGQNVPVTYLRLIAEDTIDQVIAAALARKGAMAQAIVGDEPAAFSVADLTPAEFCRMLRTNELPPSLAEG
jgi:SNF2 family DNA or RNA helicase